MKWVDSKTIDEKYEIPISHGGILSNQGVSVDAFRLVHELLNFNIKKDLEVFDKTEMTSVKSAGSKNIIAVDSGAKITAKKIVYCIGYESTINNPFANPLEKKIYSFAVE